ncbi:hypothetical protein C2R22_05815 [Salinigranum rubrum]|uniref:Uncharacterized protein n=1 Tax=Salinigranum rubrum TaxID=755307 RepID=A0A2I8VH68_9EURY|nr:hypothetical protein [Salinigranum rubrum]AUV81234.1 hypothetical protein C2R22_05815 [Salinigranum rubrum]
MQRSIRQSASADHEPTGTSLIGIDAEGSEHRFDHQRNAVLVIRPGEADNSTYGCESVDAWAEKVADACGWDDLRYGESLTTTIDRAFRGDDA